MPVETNMYSQDREDKYWLFFAMLWTSFPSILSVIECPTKLESFFCFQRVKFRNFANVIIERFLQEGIEICWFSIP